MSDLPSHRWKELLTQWSEEILASNEYKNEFPPNVVASRWLGFEGATNNAIAKVENRLGVTLPPSYREFLQITNGWRMTTPFIDKLWSTEQIDWLRGRHQQDVIDPWNIGRHMFGQTESLPNEKYFVYGDAQDPVWIREEYLQTALEISEFGDAAIYLLNPQIVTLDGEWEAWILASWLPGANRYRSFWDLMQAEHERFLSLSKT